MDSGFWVEPNRASNLKQWDGDHAFANSGTDLNPQWLGGILGCDVDWGYFLTKSWMESCWGENLLLMVFIESTNVVSR